MFVLHCRWGKTPSDLDTISLYRVFDYPQGQPYILQEPIHQTEAKVSQLKLNQLYFKTSYNVDEFRIGPTMASVLRGTVPSKGSE